jgi:hypothetical protein
VGEDAIGASCHDSLTASPLHVTLIQCDSAQTLDPQLAHSIDIHVAVSLRCQDEERSMNKSSTFAAHPPRYELRFISLFNRGRGYAFPCDAEGHVEIDDLSDRGRDNYFYARAAVGSDLSVPAVAVAA